MSAGGGARVVMTGLRELGAGLKTAGGGAGARCGWMGRGQPPGLVSFQPARQSAPRSLL